MSARSVWLQYTGLFPFVFIVGIRYKLGQFSQHPGLGFTGWRGLGAQCPKLWWVGESGL